MIDHVIWDWNGTLLDDVQYGVDLMNALLKYYKKPLLNGIQEYHRVFTFPVRDYYAAVGLGGDLFDEAAVRWMDAYMRNEKICPLRADAVESTAFLREKNVRQVVISASKLSNLNIQMANRPYFDGFDPPRGLGDIYAGSKVDIALDWMRHSGAKPENTMLIGDTLHDLEVACAIGCRCILVEGGHQSGEKLRASGAQVAKNLREAVRMVMEA